MAEGSLEQLVEQAREGNRAALEEVVRQVQDRIYGLALRMLYHPADAEDATQEILIKIVTRLDGFRGESAFTTWVWRVASNHLLTTRKRRAERAAVSFDYYAEQIEKGLAASEPHQPPEGEQALIVEEIRTSCLQGLLLCLDRPQRLAYVLTEVFGIGGDQAAWILDVSPEAFRQRLSRARRRLRDFLLKHCGLLDPANPCQCARVVPMAVETGWIDPDRPLFTRLSCRARQDPLDPERLADLDELARVAELFRSQPDYDPPEGLLGDIKRILNGGDPSRPLDA
ncbi:MAG: RNA polymerase sigma factor [Proteobacteria bacterium]|nr:RNA polymerase sigma factor [Pseudomonadota bacterium]